VPSDGYQARRGSPGVEKATIICFDMMSSINLFQKMGVVLLCLSISCSIFAMKILAKARCKMLVDVNLINLSICIR